ncbi:MAG TPA: hypothetical protein VGL61_05200 [Kofleriaceae bacterium]
MNPAALFDALTIGVQLTGALGSAGRSEIHLFSYLACLLALYETKPVTEWGYSFAGTQDGSPFSPELNDAIDSLVRTGSLTAKSEAGDFFIVEKTGAQEHADLRGIESLALRERYLEGACSSLLSIPIGRIRMGLQKEPSLAQVAPGRAPRPLLEGIAYDELYVQLEALHQSLGNVVTDLLVPAVVWLSYLAKNAERPVSESRADIGDQSSEDHASEVNHDG